MRERVGATEAWEGHNVPCTPDTQIIGSANKISTPLILPATCNKSVEILATSDLIIRIRYGDIHYLNDHVTSLAKSTSFAPCH